ncbi:hypothetical protein BTN50_0660 [Candidatus Enterovibrio altilux]|uniref:Uncharacterized protein n=1 Tax=Candidatus Enterovibrio altilux TaxID=1927128 RepID=A0A291B831_9GAMM|nr:hypothetical protein BTN50_0660 [Candidatus Enterovibrio luxaltus]
MISCVFISTAKYNWLPTRRFPLVHAFLLFIRFHRKVNS